RGAWAERGGRGWGDGGRQRRRGGGGAPAPARGLAGRACDDPPRHYDLHEAAGTVAFVHPGQDLRNRGAIGPILRSVDTNCHGLARKLTCSQLTKRTEPIAWIL